VYKFNDPTPPTYFEDYLNLASVQNALGVNLNYTDSNSDIYWAFQVCSAPSIPLHQSLAKPTHLSPPATSSTRTSSLTSK